ncbi:MAG TPA: PA0069 family radical SAM protein [Gemmatales bacterium]|nr:PA0069 family radical SAM protein [Gemmatales bacterium]
MITLPLRGRAALDNPPARFRRQHHEPLDGPDVSPATVVHEDRSRSILVRNNSPDVPFTWSLNAYRGCEHGCVYCYARPTHEYLDLSPGLDFETQIYVKHDAARLLRQELLRPNWQPAVIAMSGVTDAYQPLERRLQLTRQCLEVLAEFRNPVSIVTKSRLVTRDVDLLRELAAHEAVSVCLSITTLDAELARLMEPRAPQPLGRLAAIRQLAAAGIPVGVMVAPVLPGLTDHEVPAILAAARQAGASFAGYIMLRLPFGVKELFQQWLAQHFPGRERKVLRRVRELRGGRLNDPRFGTRMSGEGIWATLAKQTFELHRKRLGFAERGPDLSTAAFHRPGPRQQLLFEMV